MYTTLAKFNNPNFKGYDACPIKNIYMQGINSDGQRHVYRELKKIARKENFDVYYFDGLSTSSDNSPKNCSFIKRWAQDDKTFIEKKGRKVIIAPESKYYNYVFARLLGATFVSDDSFKAGGNIFIGKKPNGDKWMIIGHNDKPKDKTELQNVSKTYGVKPENIHIISQPNFHLDMAVRPIGYPYILVNDEEKAIDIVPKESGIKNKVKEYYEKFKVASPHSKTPYAPCNKTVEELEKASFIPIRIGGTFLNSVNYMNAIVNKHPDGKISYITNSAKGSDCEFLDHAFERELRAKIPNIRDVHFVWGGISEKDNYNEIMLNLENLYGGLHCMTLEEPNFEAWG